MAAEVVQREPVSVLILEQEVLGHVPHTRAGGFDAVVALDVLAPAPGVGHVGGIEGVAPRGVLVPVAVAVPVFVARGVQACCVWPGVVLLAAGRQAHQSDQGQPSHENSWGAGWSW